MLAMALQLSARVVKTRVFGLRIPHTLLKIRFVTQVKNEVIPSAPLI